MSRYRFIEVEKVNHAVRTLCRVLQVSSAAYYHWSIHPLSAHASADLVLSERIAAIHARSRQTYGAPRVHAELRICGERHSRKRIARLMRRAGIAGGCRGDIGAPPSATRSRCCPTWCSATSRPHPDELWVGDITYVRTWEGWLYLSTIIDCFSRRVVGWAMADHCAPNCRSTALRMALARRNPSGTLIHHTDRGCQYTSEAYTNVLESHGVRSSLSRPGNCWDNAVAESFFTTKLDLLYRHSWPTRAAARSAIFEYIEGFYNRERRHTTLGNLSPADYESQHAAVCSAYKRVRQTGAGLETSTRTPVELRCLLSP